MTTTAKFPRAKPYKLDKMSVKALVRHRDGYRCTECGMTVKEHHEKYGRTLDVHRIIPGSKYTVRGCVALCKECHKTKPRSANGTGPRHRTVGIRGPLVLALRQYAKRYRLPVATVVRRALEQFLKAEGFWPPPD